MSDSIQQLPAALADVALIPGPACAAAAGVSLSTWNELVRTKAAPQPAYRAPRCTRWRLNDVRQWLIARAEQGAGADAAAVVLTTATKGTAAAKAKRTAAKLQAVQ